MKPFPDVPRTELEDAILATTKPMARLIGLSEWLVGREYAADLKRLTDLSARIKCSRMDFGREPAAESPQQPTSPPLAPKG